MAQSVRRFIVCDGIGAALWADLGIYLGSLFSTTIDDLLNELPQLGQYWMILVAVGFSVFVAIKWWQQRRLRLSLRMARISVAELNALQQQGSRPAIVDVRLSAAQQTGRIPGAHTISHHEINSFVPDVSVDQEVIVYCACPNETAAAMVGKQLMPRESLAGTWEALLERCVDFLIAALGQGLAGGGYNAEPVGTISFAFVVVSTHPLADVKKVLGKAELLPHRAISVADSASKMASRTVGLLFGKDALTVPDMRSKYVLQLVGIGFGFLPEPCARGDRRRRADRQASKRAEAGRDIFIGMAQR